VQKHNVMLTEEIEELRSNARELQGQIKSLHQELTASRKECEQWQRKSSEWEAKSGEWTDKAHLWKDRAEKWEKVAKEADPSSSHNEPAVDPQANFLQAALERKKLFVKAESKWNVLGGLLAGRTASEDLGHESPERLHELEAENAKQAEIIKNLRSEMMKMQTTHKDAVYSTQQKMLELEKERDDVQLKNRNLMKELELARKLDAFAARDRDDV
jgi:chromosome segregation ATPase